MKRSATATGMRIHYVTTTHAHVSDMYSACDKVRMSNGSRMTNHETIKDLPHGKLAEEGDRLIRAARAHGGHTTVATLREMPLLRLLRRIRETTDGEAPTGLSLTCDELTVHVVGSDGATHTVRTDEFGEFIDLWPDGFFDARAEELF